MVIGVDTHKSSHAMAAVAVKTGLLASEREIAASEDGHRQALSWARGLRSERVWAIEDCRHVSRRLEQALIAAGELVLRVPPKMMGASRRGEREPGKSDQIDARAVARAVVKEGVERFPTAFLDERALEIRLLADHRSDLVAERTRQINRLRWHLVDLCPDLEASIPARRLASGRTLDRIARRLRREERAGRAWVALELVASIRAISLKADRLDRELRALVLAYRPTLLAEQGLGVVTAATLIGRTAGAERFPTDAHFARQAGVAPIPVSSGAQRPSSPAPRRRPPAQPCAARDRDHPRPDRPADPRLPRSQACRGQDQPRGPTLPEASSRPPRPPSPLDAPAHADPRTRIQLNSAISVPCLT